MKKLLNFFFCFLPILSCAQEVILLNEDLQEIEIFSSEVLIYEDKTNKLTIEDISRESFQANFKAEIITDYPENTNPQYQYWVKFKIKKKSKNNTLWILESSNHRLNQLQVYTSDSHGIYATVESGDIFPFSSRIYQHRNFIFPLEEQDNNEKTYFVKFSSTHTTPLILVLRTHAYLTGYSVTEYFLLGFFYGMVLIIAIYNLFLFIRLLDKAYLYYVLYVLSVGMFAMCQDGIAFQYIWPEHPEWNENSVPVALYSMICWLLLYTKSFLSTKAKLPRINKVINGYIIFRTVLFLLTLSVFPALKTYILIDLAPYAIAYITAIISLKNGSKPSRFFVIGFTVLFIGFLITSLRLLRIIPTNVITLYAMNIAALLEMLLLSMALAERIKQLLQKETVKEQINRELENKVRERTQAILLQKNIIEEKAKELDTFIYKASHDIKGPLRSIMGLASLGKKDKEENSKQYFDHILKSSIRLDSIVKDLLEITQINRGKVRIAPLDLSEMINEIKQSFQFLPDFDKIRIETRLYGSSLINSERTTLYSIFQNLIENAIKYRKPDAPDSFLIIDIKVNAELTEIYFIDNGRGIAKEYQERVFEMFFKLYEDVKNSTGLGLYIVKISVQRLGGKIELISTEGKGTTFHITLPSSSPQ